MITADEMSDALHGAGRRRKTVRPDGREAFEVDPWRMSLLWETSKRFSPYAKYFVRQWVKNVIKGDELPKDEKTWSEEEQNDSD